ncbi:MAG: 30S ribosomal protein S4 [Candidatus Omnitrophica bacterium]|nr:30S ribosomal protein S4 [Candidatus Omnitrophota bacterium]
MARRTGAKCRLCRRESMKLYLKGIRCSGDKCAIERRNTVPGQHVRAKRKLSTYGVQLREKQKMKKMYGMLEKQFRIFFDRSARKKGVTGDILIQLLERRLDNIIYRLLFVTSRAEARQMVYHGLIKVNGKKVTIPSYTVKVDDVIEVAKKDSVEKRVKDNLEMFKDRVVPEWLSLDRNLIQGKIERLPTKVDAHLPIEENLIVELYSK